MKVSKIENANLILSNTNNNYITKSGDYLEVRKYSNTSHCNVINISKTEYATVNNKTGEIEIKNKKLSENRLESEKNLKKTFHNLRNLIQANVIDNNKVHWITLTYNQDNGVMDDTLKLYKDVEIFFKKFRRWLKTNKNINHIEYITTVEPQGCGAWHAHILIIYDVKRPFIDNNVISILWGNGFTKTKALKDTDNIANYLCSYLTDLKIDDHIKKKGERLFLYPRGIRIYRHSRGVKIPEHFILDNQEYLDLINNYNLEFEGAYKIANEEDETIRTIKKEFYKRKSIP